MENIKSVRVESSLLNKELTIMLDTDLGGTELGVMLARSRSDGWFFVILRDECGYFLKVMEMADTSTKEYKVFKSDVDLAGYPVKVTVTIEVEYRRWSVEVE